MSAPWKFPQGYLLLIPFFFVVAMWVAVLVEHLVNLEKLYNAMRFQALYSRMMFLLPVLATISLCSAYWPWTEIWFEVALGIIEGYLILGVFCIVVGLGQIKTHGHLPDVLMKNDWTKSQFRCCGAPFKNGDDALWFWKWSVIQMMFVGPVLKLIYAIYFAVTGKLLTNAQNAPLVVARVLSIFFAALAVLRVNFGISQSAPGNPLEGHKTLWKLFVIKLIFFFVILNSIVLNPLISAGILGVDAWLCAENVINTSQTYLDYCELRLIMVIFIFELVVCTIPAALVFRHHEFENSRSVAFSDQTYSDLVFRYFVHVVSVWDVNDFLNGSMKKWKSSDAEDSEEERLLEKEEERGEPDGSSALKQT